MNNKGTILFVLGLLTFSPLDALAQLENRTVYSTYSLTAESNGGLVTRSDTTTRGFDLYGGFDGVNVGSTAAGRYYDFDFAADTEIWLIDRPLTFAYGTHNAEDIGQIADNSSANVFQDHLVGFTLTQAAMLSVHYHHEGGVTNLSYEGSGAPSVNYQGAATIKDASGMVYYDRGYDLDFGRAKPPTPGEGQFDFTDDVLVPAGTYTTYFYNRATSSEIGNADAGIDNAAVLQIDVSPVPEPSALAALGVGGVAILRRRKRA